MIYELHPLALFAAFLLALIAALCYMARNIQLKKELACMTEDRDDWRRMERAASESFRVINLQSQRWRERCDALREDVASLENRVNHQ